MDSESFWKWVRLERTSSISDVCNFILTIAARVPQMTERQGIFEPELDSGRLQEDGRRTGISASKRSSEASPASGKLSRSNTNTDDSSSAEIRRWRSAVEQSTVGSTQLRTSSPSGRANYKQQLDRERQIMERERQRYLETIQELREKLDKEVQSGKLLNRLLTEARDEAANYAEQYDAVRKELDHVEKEKAYEQDVRRENLEQEVKAAKFQAQNFGKLVTESHNEVEKLVDENRALRNERKSVDEEINALREAKQKYERREKGYINETTVLRERVAHFENEASRLTSINNTITQDNSRLTEENAKFVDAINSASTALEVASYYRIERVRSRERVSHSTDGLLPRTSDP